MPLHIIDYVRALTLHESPTRFRDDETLPELPAGSGEIRPATEGDLGGIEALARRVLPPTYVDTGLLEESEVESLINGFWTPNYFSTVLGDGLLWVVKADGVVVGAAEVARAGETDAVLWKLYLDIHLQRKGLGSRLLAAVASDLWPGTRRLLTEYVTGNQPAASFYARHGFEFDRVEPDTRPDVDATYTWCVRDAAAPFNLS